MPHDFFFPLSKERDQQRATSYFAHQLLQPLDNNFWALKEQDQVRKHFENLSGLVATHSLGGQEEETIS